MHEPDRRADSARHWFLVPGSWPTMKVTNDNSLGFAPMRAHNLVVASSFPAVATLYFTKRDTLWRGLPMKNGSVRSKEEKMEVRIT